ncbi:MAG: uroporphyrinogen decarboxylase [Anaerolineae bacterium]|nr:uroporphyrinogen decarboxylase [Anaerolineae bacterium]
MASSRTLNHRDRILACISGQPLDRPPVALWRHFPVDDQTPEGLAAATAEFQNRYDFDLIKVTPASSFCIKDWGSQDAWRGNPEGTRDYTHRVIQVPEEWSHLPALNPEKGWLGGQLACLQLLIQQFSATTPILQTIFSPLSQAKNLVGNEKLPVHLRQAPDALHAGLETITQSTLTFLEAARKTGIDGIFYAVQHAQRSLLAEPEFIEFGRAYDLRILDAARDLSINMVHLHGTDTYFDLVAGYPAHILNWHDRQTEPALSDGLKRFPGAACGGLRQWETLVLSDSLEVRSEALEALKSTHGQRFILGTGCVTPVTAPSGNIWAARKAVENFS